MTDDVKENYENLFKTALIAAQSSKIQPFETIDGRLLSLVPKGFDLKDVSDPDRLDYYAGAEIIVDEKQALIDYVNRFKEPGTVLFADVDKGTVTAVIDYHMAPGGDAVESGPRRHMAALRLRSSEEFLRWDEFEGKLHKQEEFAIFLEENAVDISEPDPAIMIDLARDLAASAGMEFQSKVDLNSGDRTFHYKNETKLDERIKAPREFLLEIPLYQGEEPITCKAAFRYRVGAGGLSLGFEWRRVKYQQLSLFKSIAYAVAEATGAPVYLGREAFGAR